jgi:hypothetical protein
LIASRSRKVSSEAGGPALPLCFIATTRTPLGASATITLLVFALGP